MKKKKINWLNPEEVKILANYVKEKLGEKEDVIPLIPIFAKNKTKNKKGD